MPIDQLAVRVARRHVAVALRDVHAPARTIEFSAGGRVSGVELAEMLERTCGLLTRLVFHRPPGGPSNEVGWAAVDQEGGVVSGTLLFNLAVGEHEVMSWVQASINPRGTSIVVDPAALRLIEPADRTAERIAVEYQRRRHGLEHVEPADEDGQGDGRTLGDD